MIYLGQSLRRFEDHRLLTGQSQFVDDITLPDMLHAVVLRSPHAHATITAIEVAAARHATGVVVVVTASDLEQVAAHIPTRRNADADEISPPEHPVLASDKVCYVGQPVAIVVAQSPATARDALELIEVDYAPLPAVIDPLQAMHPDTPVIHAELGTNCVLKITSAGGDLEAAFARADHVVRQQYQVQRLAPVPMETRGLATVVKGTGARTPNLVEHARVIIEPSVPRATHVPTLILDTLETLSPLTPLGVKGIGELPTLAAPAAVANAVMDALSPWGVRHIDTPLTPEKNLASVSGGSSSMIPRCSSDPIARPLGRASRSLTPIPIRTGDDDGHGTCPYCRVR